MEQVKKAYEEIFKALKKHKDICVFDVEDLERKSKVHLFGLTLKEEYGLNIDPKQVQAVNYFKPSDHTWIGWYGEKHNRTISWSVDGRQPEDELLLQIGFPTGAYIFGEDYATDFFQKFWLELKTYKPDYIDEANCCLYWNIKNAKEIFNSYNALLKKYYELNKEDAKQRLIDKMKKELEQLEKSS